MDFYMKDIRLEKACRLFTSEEESDDCSEKV
jgi:hypothetical protein